MVQGSSTMALGNQEKKKKRKKALVLLTALRSHLKATCGTYATANDWYTMIKEKVDPIFQHYSDVLPQGMQDRLRAATKLTDDSREGIGKSCQLLQSEVGKLIGTLSPGIGATALTGVFLAGIVAVGVAIIYLKQNAVSVIIKNQGCSPIQTVAWLPQVTLPGLELPTAPIPSGGQATAKLPPLSFTVDNTDQSEIILRALGMTLRFSLASEGINLVFDGSSLLNRLSTINLGEQKEHMLVVSCR